MADVIKDIFGESDDDDDDEQPPENVRDLFNFSDDEEEPRPKKKKKTLGKAKKGSKAVDDEGNAYESGDEIEVTADDRAFIDNDDDDDELLKEYSKDKQRFDDDEVDNEFEDRDRPLSSDAAPAKDDDNPISQTMNAMKRSRRKEMSSDEKDRVVQKLLERMNRACEDDRASIERGVPALAKLALVPIVERVLKQRALHASLLEHDALIEIRAWLEPDSSGGLPALNLRSPLLEALQPLHATVDALKRSRLGVLIMKYARDKREIPRNQRLAKKLVELWSRPIVGKDSDYRALERAHEHVAQQSVRGRIATLDSHRDDVQDIVREEEANRPAGDAHLRGRVRVPRFEGFNFVIRPNAAVDGAATTGRRNNPNAKLGIDTARGRIQRKLKKR